MNEKVKLTAEDFKQYEKKWAGGLAESITNTIFLETLVSIYGSDIDKLKELSYETIFNMIKHLKDRSDQYDKMYHAEKFKNERAKREL